ncbi:hypothetical protein GGR92_003636 [Spirosoma lacussanchae]|uniref:hypothetical protein n=1 Tax=Spirosoma lacussanchae TaxID=1884249 RepID=UPI001108A798|nr:hypothetical protein [Spirosoma lacussanchae]
MTTHPTLDREQIEALPDEQVANVYEKAKSQLDSLLSRVETDNQAKAILQANITAARLQYIMLRFRRYPKHFAKVNLAA